MKTAKCNWIQSTVLALSSADDARAAKVRSRSTRPAATNTIEGDQQTTTGFATNSEAAARAVECLDFQGMGSSVCLATAKSDGPRVFAGGRTRKQRAIAPDYPSSGRFPAEPDSVSSGEGVLHPHAPPIQQKSTSRRLSQCLLNPKLNRRRSRPFDSCSEKTSTPDIDEGRSLEKTENWTSNLYLSRLPSRSSRLRVPISVLPKRLIARACLAAAIFAALILPCRICRAVDTMGLVGEFSLPDRLRNLVDTQDEYFRAVQRLQDDDAAVMRARESAMKDAQSTADYAAAVKAVDQAYQAFIEKKNGTISNLEKTNAIYCGMKSHVAQIDGQIDTARQNSATTQDQFEQLYKDRETFVHQCQQAENDALERDGAAPLRQAWVDASKKLSDLQERQRTDVESNDRLKTAVAEAAAAKTAVDEARAAISSATSSAGPGDGGESRAADLLYRSTRANFAGNDAWLTYGWTNLSGSSGSKPAGTSAPAAEGKR